MKPSSKTYIQTGILFFIALLLSSCENFLKSEDVAKEIKDHIAYNNAPSSTLVLNTPEGTGRFLSGIEKSCKLGYTIDIQFAVNSKDYVYTGMKAVSKSNSNLSRAEYVQFTDISTEEEKSNGNYKVQIKLLKLSDDIMIQPVCLLLPKIISVTPASESLSYANTPIIITFNMAMKEDAISKVKLEYSNEDISEYFKTPIFNQERTILTINPKPIELMSLMNNVAYIDINLRLGSDITIENNQTILPLYQNEFSDYTIRYRQATESTPPEKQELYVFKNPTNLASINLNDPQIISSGKIKEENLTKELVLAHRTTNTVWIYGKYYDSESGLSAVTVKERLTYTSNGDFINRGNENSWDYEKTYNANDMEINYYGQGYASFCIKHDLNTEDGLIDLFVESSDLCNNHDKGEIVTLVKNTNNPLNDVLPYNSSLLKDKPYELAFDKTEYEEGLKTVNILEKSKCTDTEKIKDGKTLSNLQIYKNYYLEPQDFELWCNYKASNGEKMLYDKNEGKWYINLNVEKVSALPITISYKEKNGIIWNNHYRFGGIPYIAGKNGSTYKVYSATEFTTAYSVRLGENNSLTYYHYIYSNSIYSMLANGNLYGDLYPVNPENYSFNSSLSDIEITDISYSNKNDNSGETQIIVSINESVWNTYESIYCATSYPNSEIIFVKNNSSQFIYIIETNKIWNADTQLRLWGVTRDGVTSSDFYKSLPKLSTYGNEYDNKAPELKQEDYFTLTKVKNKIDIPYYFDYPCLIKCYDKESGLKTFNVYLQDLPQYNIDYIYVEDNFYAIPFYDAGDYPFFFAYAKDNNNNQSYTEFSRYNKYPIPAFTAEKSGTSYIFKGQSDKEIFTEQNKGNLYISPLKFVCEEGQTSYEWKACLSNPDYISINTNNISADDKGSYTYVSSSTNLPENTFIRIMAYITGGSTPNTYFYPADAQYYYTGTPSSGEGTDYLFDNKKMILIGSDQPVFVHTLVTKRDYSECGTWDEKQWEHNRRHINDTLLNFSPDNRSPQVYTVDTSSIDSGDYYVVIAHFANGKTAMSDVMQK